MHEGVDMAGTRAMVVLATMVTAFEGCAPSVDGNWTIQINGEAGLGLFAQDGDTVTGVVHWHSQNGQVRGSVHATAKDNVSLRFDFEGGGYLDIVATRIDDGHLDGRASGALASSLTFLDPDWMFFPVGGGGLGVADVPFTANKPP